MVSHKKISLVLGSGGARGIAHIGVINELQKAGYEICAISGCSIGALIGGVFAAGKLKTFESWVCAISKSDILRLLDLSWGSSGLVKGDRIISTLVKLVGDIRIEDLPIPFTAVATNISNNKEVWLNSGSLFEAIRASISLPLFFTPVIRNDECLIDGGVLNPVPIAPTFNDTSDMTIAVNLGGERQKDSEDVLLNQVAQENNSNTLQSKVEQFIAELKGSNKEPAEKKLGAYAVADQAFDAMQITIARQKLVAYPPDFMIEIARNACGTLEFDRSEEMIELGASKAREFIRNQKCHFI